MQDYAAEKLEQLLEMYKNDQSSFSKEYLYLTYSYYNMWIAMEKVGNAEKALVRNYIIYDDLRTKIKVA